MTCRQQMKWKVGNFLGETVTLKPRFLTLGGRALLLSIVVPHTLLLASVVGQAHCCSVVTDTVNTSNTVQLPCPNVINSSAPRWPIAAGGTTDYVERTANAKRNYKQETRGAPGNTRDTWLSK